MRALPRFVPTLLLLASLGCGDRSLPPNEASGVGGTSGASGGTSGASGGTSGACGRTPGLPAASVSHIATDDVDCGLGGASGNGGGSGGGAADCSTSADCPGTSFCACAVHGGLAARPASCIAAECRIDADCPSRLCSQYEAPCRASGDFEPRRACRTSADTCSTDDDCAGCAGPPGMTGVAGAGGGRWACQYVAEVGHWQCATFYVCAGG
jgi:hypothetical protein